LIRKLRDPMSSKRLRLATNVIGEKGQKKGAAFFLIRFKSFLL